MSDSSPNTPSDFMPHGEGYLFDHLGMEFSFSDSGEVTGRIQLQKHHFAWSGRIHAGTLLALADSCAGQGCLRLLPEGAKGFTTIEIKTNFVGTTDQGAIRGVAVPVHLGRTTQVWDASIFTEEDERVLAHFRCTQMILWPR